ncbi:RNase adapter RapZ [Modestobacter sp. I12A-02628]|uniref:RNase adapter RapZ n=1 Tax=Goekera deserti TaxID=2497753 RepID=A0A7K3WDJ5_9ACTN|nr:RNase adapter RapZ [Goekera deserti]MPQ96817.1 RNase adapter RapZ [Goekera deserti]NDI46869.1 RNase adapter RapZ [Goekera deserti]NEL54437.1 RNase adapter RapZ [Goekera deserti]
MSAPPGGTPAAPADEVAPDGAADQAPARPVQVVVVTGLSGAGKNTAGRVLEDLGFFVVDNLPPALLEPMVELGARGDVRRFAAVVDVRSRAFSSDLQDAVRQLADIGHRPRVLYVHARDEVLVRRYESVRREHPLQGSGRLVDGISAERALLTGIAGDADLWVDTSDLNVHQLRATLEAAFADDGEVPALTATVLSFGFKYGLPLDADLVVDARFLPNPHWLPELRPKTGRDPEVREYVLSRDGALEFVDRYTDVLRLLLPGYRREGKRYLTLAVGCTGGKHRSVAITEEFARRLSAEGVSATARHRDLGRE